MSKKQWLVLLMLFLTYLLLGASIFYHIESRLEIERVEKEKRERIEINALLHAHYVPSFNHDHDDILGKLTRYCGRSVYNYTEGETDPLKWDFYNSFYFAYTVVSTIGYGNLAPTNMLGRILMIFYGLIGIPMNGILLTQLGEFFGQVFVKAYEKYKSYKDGHNDYYPRKLTTFETGKLGFAAQIFAHLMPGFVMFIFFPALLFSHYEGWSYDEAVYYAFVTLTTIGFGDYVAGQDNSKGSGFFFMLYKTFLICWISFGLGYTVMIMTFIGRGMQSKKIARIEHKLAANLKHTQSKIWNEFNKEMNYLRRVFNELQLSKVKRVYVDECNYEDPPCKFPRSNSFPDLRQLMYGSKKDDTTTGHKPRRRANSEMVRTEDQVTRVVSETDLQRIDKAATFATHAMVQPAELLARLVNILGYIPPATEDIADVSNQTTFIGQDTAYKGNKIDDLCGKEKGVERESAFSTIPGIWSIGQDKIPRFGRPRSRTASEFRLQETKNEDRNIERTWSGPTAARRIQELMRRRTSEASGKDRIKETKFSKLRSFAFPKSVPKAFISSAPWKHRFSTSASEKRNPEFDQEVSCKDVEQFASGPTSIEDRRDSNLTIFGPRRHYYTHTGAGNGMNAENANNLLEETSLADFLRALTVLHASVATNNSWTAPSYASVEADDQIRQNQPRRKMGTASLTPPKLPSLFTLFSPAPPVSTNQSNQNTITQQNGGNWDEYKPPWSRRESRRDSLVLAPPTVIKNRRFSLRPVATPISPPTPPRNESPFLSDSRRTLYENKSTFLFDSPKEPLITTEGAPGLSSPMKPSPNARRFSLRPAQNQGAASSGNNPTSIVPTLKAIPRWKAGMLQRQIGQMNLRRRVRAFSLSDVQAGDAKKEKTEPLELPSNASKQDNGSAAGENVSVRGDSGNVEQADSVERLSQPEEAPFTSPIRFEERSLQSIDPQIQMIASRNTVSNVRTHFSRLAGECVDPEPSCSSKELPVGVERQTFSSAVDRGSFAGVHIESQEPLVEVKVESPGENAASDPSRAVADDFSLKDSSGDLAQLKIETDKPKSPTEKKT